MTGTTRQATFKLKRSNVSGKIPTTSQLLVGELAVNSQDGFLYTSIANTGGTDTIEVRQIGWDRLSTLSGGTVNGNVIVNGSVSATTYYGDGSNLTGLITTDYYVTGGTFSNGTLTLNRQNGSVTVTGFTSTDTFVTGFTYSDNNLKILQNQGQPDLTVNISTMTGLTVNGNISTTSLNTNYIDFNTTATTTTQFGRINWDSGTGTLNIGVGDSTTGLVDFQVGQEEVVRVYNSELTTLQKGEIVYVSGSQGNRPSVKRASAVSDGYSVTTLGMVDIAIPSGSEGYITTFGIISNLDTSSLTGGTPIWLSPTTPGAYTSTKPIAPQHTVLIGYVVRVSATVGSIFINISNGWELDELHDVRISGATEGDLLVRSTYNGSSVWVNSKTLNGNYTISGNTSHIGDFSVTGNTNLQGVSATNINATNLYASSTLSAVTGNITTVNSTTGNFTNTFVPGTGTYNNLTVTGNTNLQGVTATTFTGDGSGLRNVTNPPSNLFNYYNFI